MKRRILYFVMAVCTMLVTSCSDDEILGDNNGQNDSKAIQFGVTTTVVESRTVYGDPGEKTDWPLYWKANDQIHIYCPDAEDTKLAAYVVAPKDGSATTHEGTISPLTEGEVLKWSGDSDPHDFYAAYPYGKATNVELAGDKSTAYITFAVNNNQTCTINTTPSDGNFIAEPDMTNAYMVAHNLDVNPYDGDVSLDFKPIMTTLVVKVTAPTWVQNTTGHATITGISVVTEIDSKDADEGKFVYDVANGEIVTNASGTGAKTSHTTFVGVKHVVDNSTTNNFIDLKSGETLTMTVFLPPIPIDSENPVQVKLHVAGSDFIAHLGETPPSTKPSNHIYANVNITPSQIRRVNLPSLPDPLPDKSNWLTLLDDDIFVSQLSIPGTHDAATSSLEASATNAGKTQSYTITEQLAMGIRAFDLRPVLKTGGFFSWGTTFENIHHGLLDTGVSLDDAFAMIDSYLSNNEKEFVILVMRNESGDAHPANYITDDQKSTCATNFKTAMANYLAQSSVYQKRKIDYKPDLTVGDMRSNGIGKILILLRDPYGDSPTLGGAFIGWSHNQNGTLNATMQGISTSGTLCVQDLYKAGEMNSDENRDFSIVKPESAMRMMDYSARFHIDDGLKNVWMINHCSGYTGINNYPQNGVNTNLPVYNYLVGNTGTSINNYSNTPKAVGSTGIVMLDFVGARNTTYIGVSYQVYGDLLPQTIIDNNYKYVMKRKAKR